MNVDVRDAKTPREGYRNIAKKKEKNGRRRREERGEREEGYWGRSDESTKRAHRA